MTTHERRARVKAALAALPRDRKHFAIRSYLAMIKGDYAKCIGGPRGVPAAVRLCILQTVCGDMP